MNLPQTPTARWLREWLPQRRWFGGKGAPITSVQIDDGLALDAAGNQVVIASVAAQGLPLARYLVLPAARLCGEWLDDSHARSLWLARLSTRSEHPARHGRFLFEPLAPFPAVASSRLLGAEQSNTSVLFTDAAGQPAFLCKLIRRLLPGENPDFEIPRALAAHTGFRNVPAVLGRARYEDAAGSYTLAVAQQFVPNRGDGWQYVLRRLGEGATLEAEIELLARRTAELHLALASILEPDFAPEVITAEDLAWWRDRALAGADLAVLQSYRESLASWRAALATADAGLAPCLGCSRIRIHGDYHLGQVLYTGDDFYLFDFEGEPSRPIPDRRRKLCVLQDVAGMLRSFSYAAHTAARPEWEGLARHHFLGAYRAAIAAHPGLAPAEEAAFAAALRFFETEKAVYELAYELNHRPDWVRVPLTGLRLLLATS